MTPPTLNSTLVATSRITTIDVTRGLVMIIMALDHVRDLMHISALDGDPTNLASTTVPLFFTRWVTHLCAPTFVFLSGTSVYLSLQKRANAGQSINEGHRFLLKRGLVLVLLELTIINFAFWFDLEFKSLMLQVIWAIGGGLVMLSFLSRLSVRQVGIIGVAILVLHNLLFLLPPITNNASRFVFDLFFRTEFFLINPNFAVLVAYPLIPWLGIMMVGYALGPLFEKPLADRKRRLALFGMGALGLFVLLRFINSYGDQAPWAVQKTGLFTLLSFINVSKYPPSLLYCLLMLGIALLILSLADGVTNTITRILTVYGAVPMFYYILHWYFVHILMLAMAFLQGYTLADIPDGPFTFGRPKGSGVSLDLVYAVWFGLAVALYPLCQWYGRYKAAHPEKGWLRYI